MRRVLLIEPDRLLSKTYARALEKAGYKVDAATTAQEAIDYADKRCPDVVILEIQLVSHSGIEFLYEFRSYPDWQKVPVLIHTGVPFVELNDGWSVLSDHLGVSHYRYKPTTNLKVLIGSVNELAEISE